MMPMIVPRSRYSRTGRQAMRLLIAGLAGLLGYCVPAHAQDAYPHLLVRNSDRAAVLQKIESQPWAHHAYEEMLNRVTPYVIRHERDPDWILSRYLMNRVPGKRYTAFYSDASGTRLTGYGGDAPRPTVRVSPHKRSPITTDGHDYRLPSLEEMVPNDTSMTMRLQRNAPDSGWVVTDPQSFVGALNGRINALALDAAIIYWLTGKEAYGRFAADILDQWAHGAFYQQPIIGPCRTGFLDIQTLGDNEEVPLILSYDFLHDFLLAHRYDLSPYETVFDKIAATMTFRGFWNNNWFAAQTPPLVMAALSLKDTARRNEYLRYYLTTDTIQGACGHLAIPSMISRWLTPDGHWKETAGYHNFATGNFLLSALVMEKNGYPVFEQYPALFGASYVLLKYAFPNLKNPAFGDNGSRPSQSPRSLEIALWMAEKMKDQALVQNLSRSMRLLIASGAYNRGSSGYLGLLSFVPTLPAAHGAGPAWPRSGKLDYASLYLQRNGADSVHGLMYVVQGGTYNHNHAGGMAMELYGEGKVMGADPGDGLNYDDPLHVRYYAEWAAHNTVVADGRSGPIPRFTGGGGAKRMGRISLVSMEPAPDSAAVSPWCAFTDTRYTDEATGAPEQRTMALIRLNDTAGYYVDIYRAGDSVSNDYVYHNIGKTVRLLDSARRELPLKRAAFPLDTADHDPPGFGAMHRFQSSGVTAGTVIARFGVGAPSGPPPFMQVCLPGAPGRSYYTALAPPTHTAGRAFDRLPTPVVMIHQQGSAWDKPFLAVYEPYRGEKGYAVSSVKRLPSMDPGAFTALEVREAATGRRQRILEATDPSRGFQAGGCTLQGDFAVVSFDREDRADYLYLGKGRRLSAAGYSLVSEGAIACSLECGDGEMMFSCTGPLTLRVPTRQARAVKLLDRNGKEEKSLTFTREGDRLAIRIPCALHGKIKIMP